MALRLSMSARALLVRASDVARSRGAQQLDAEDVLAAARDDLPALDAERLTASASPEQLPLAPALVEAIMSSEAVMSKADLLRAAGHDPDVS
jgi:hypothetical protein